MGKKILTWMTLCVICVLSTAIGSLWFKHWTAESNLNQKSEVKMAGSEVDIKSILNKTVPRRFTIEKGKELFDYLDFQTAIDVAEYFRIPVYRANAQSERFMITYGAARKIGQSKVITGVSEGDVIDLENEAYLLAPVRITHNGKSFPKKR
jgi:hypothetical protein